MVRELKIDVGVCTLMTVNLTKIDFKGIEKVVFTVKNTPDIHAPAIIEREYTEPAMYDLKITPEESLMIKSLAVWDFNKVLKDGTRIKLGDTGKVVLRKGAGDCIG